MANTQTDQPTFDQATFVRGWRMAMELVQGECEDEGQPIPDCVIEALQPCQHDSISGDTCDWCATKCGCYATEASNGGPSGYIERRDCPLHRREVA